MPQAPGGRADENNIRRAWLTLLLSLALALIAAAPASAAKPFGFADIWSAQTIAMSAGDGAAVDRAFVLWSNAEPSRGADFDWLQTDVLAREMTADGVKPLWVIYGTPSWARDRSLGCGSQLSCPPTSSSVGRLAAFAQALALRYPGSAGIEIWNEPNWKHFWTGTADRYTDLLTASYRAVKTAAPQMPVISAGLAGGGEDTVPAQRWLDAMYDAGAKGDMDGVGLHLYPGPRGGPVVFDVQEHLLGPVRKVIADHGDASTPLWITEFGIPTDGDGSTFYRQSEADQAQAYGAVASDLMCQGDIAALVIWRHHDGPTPDGVDTMGMGVRREDLSPKPAVAALKDAVAGAASCPAPTTLSLTADAPMPLKVGQTVNLTVGGMPAGALSYSWDLTGRGYYGTKTDGPTLARAFPKAGHYRPAVRVSDGLHVWGAKLDVDVGTTAKPIPVINSSPAAKAAGIGSMPVLRIRQWQRVVFDSRGSQADPLTFIKQVTWRVQRAPRRGTWRNHAKVLRYAWRKAGTMKLGLVVRDKHGATATTWIKVVVKKACRPGARKCRAGKR